MTKLSWEKEYAIEKFLPLLTRWHLKYDDNFQANISMKTIVKKRVNKGIKCYEIKWNNYEIATIEPQSAVQKRYPEVSSLYEDMHTKCSNKPKKKGNFNILFYFILFNYNIKYCITFRYTIFIIIIIIYFQ